MTSAAPHQVRALLSLRWRMVRARPLRTVLTIIGLALVALGVLIVLAAARVPLGAVASTDPSVSDMVVSGAPTDRTGEVAALLPSAMLAFVLLCIVAPLTAGGGYELFPESELVAYPVRVSTLVRTSLVLSPLNIAWYLQVLVLSAATAYAIRGPGGPTIPLVVLLTFLAACTTVGHAIGWTLVGVRRTRRGRIATWVGLAALVALATWIVVTDRGTDLLDLAPTRKVLGAQLRGARGDFGGWGPTVAILVIACVLGYLATVKVAAWALRRPGDHGVDGPLTRPVRRREQPLNDRSALLHIDRASVWRSPPIRRGLLVLAILPVAAAMIASLPWSSIALLPPLVSSGAALLFGVNALALDGSGATWVSSLPHDPELVLRSKARVVAEIVGGAVVLVLVGAMLRSSERPTAVDVVCVLGSALSCIALVVAVCVRLSVTRPHRADLRGARDTPAPPGSMAFYSAGLAATTTSLGLVFSASTFGAPWQAPVLITLGVLSWAAWSWTGTRRRWAEPTVRADVVATVSAG
jgi:hypothetical protein